MVDDYRGGSYGFPSCHSANSFALASFMALLVANSGFRIFIFTWALLNSYTRLYLGVHYPGDLLTGAIIGSVFGCLCFLIARQIDLRAIRNEMKTATWRTLIATRLHKPMLIVSPASGLNEKQASLRITPLSVLYIVAAMTLTYILIASL